MLVAARTLVLVSLTHWATFLGVLWSLEVTPHSAVWQPLVLVALGAADTIFLRVIRARPLAGETLPELASAFRTTFALGFALASAVVLFGFVLYFISGRFWIYLLGLSFGLPMLAMIAPTRYAIEQRQREIGRSGKRISLIEAVMLPGSALPRPTR